MVERFLWALLLLTVTHGADAADRLQHERVYQERWCVEGITEYRLDDSTRVDCLTAKYAIEFDFADKWAEAVGQSLHYADMTGRSPGIVLIVEDFERDLKHVNKITELCAKYDIRLWLTH